MTVVAVSGYFDPIHVGHLEYLKMAKSLGDKLVVIVNSDYQAELKKGKSFKRKLMSGITKTTSLRPSNSQEGKLQSHRNKST